MTHSFFERLLDRIDPHRSHESPEQQQARVLCGRWLALQRIQRGLTSEQLADLCDVEPMQILYLETGVGVADDLNDAAAHRLADTLAADASRAEYVGVVLQTALGNRPVDPRLLAEVQAELQQMT